VTTPADSPALRASPIVRMLDCICGHRHAHKSKCKDCPCRYGTDDRKASNRAVAAKVNGTHPGMKALRKYFTPEVIAEALRNERGGK
jgi:hypothetical protein